MEHNKKKYSAFFNIPRRKGKFIDWKKLNRNAKWRKNIACADKINAHRLAVFQPEFYLCPICKGEKFRYFIEVYKCKYSQCDFCGHIFQNPPLDLNVVKNLYSGGEGGSAQKLVYLDENLFCKRIEQIALPKINYCNSIIGKERGLWVDIGCGTGELLAAAQKTGWKTQGFEADPMETDFARKHGIDVVREYVSAENVPKLKDAKVVSLISILEHIKNPAELLKAVSDSISKKVFVIFEVPRHPSLSSFINLVFPDLPYRHICPPDHMHIFTEKSVEIMLNEAGLKAVSIWEFGQDALDLVITAANNNHMEENEFIEQIFALAGDMQKVVDEQSLSDLLLMIAIKN